MGAVALKKVMDAVEIEVVEARWKLAEQHLLGMSQNPEAGKLALHAVVSHDVPMLLNELKRLERQALKN
jgi:hypothetical protein